MEEKRKVLEDNVRHSFMGVTWSHKIQEKQADILTNGFNRYEKIRIICSSLTSVGLLSIIFVDKFWVKLISTLVSFISTSISMFFKSFEIQKNISNHKRAANDLLILRDKFRLLLLEIQMNISDTEELYQKYEMLQEQLGEVYKDAPNTSDEAVEKAAVALKINKDNEFSDEEIDLNLPKSLQRRPNEANES